MNFNEEAKIKILSLSPLTDSKAVSKGMCHTIAYSGLAFEHLKLAFNRNGRQGVMDVLTEEVNGKARVTRSKKVVDSISDYFQCKASEIYSHKVSFAQITLDLQLFAVVIHMFLQLLLFLQLYI